MAVPTSWTLFHFQGSRP